jgi:hypothetical protein
MKTNVKNLDRQVLMAVLAGFAITLFASCTGGKREIPDSPYTRTLNATQHQISKDKALAMLKTYDRNRDSLLRGRWANDTLVMPISETFNMNAVDSLVNQPGIAGLRAYLAMDPATRQIRMIFVGVDKDGKDVVQDDRSGQMKFNGRTTDSLGYIMETGNRWP